MIRVSEKWCRYTIEPSDPQGYTDKMDRMYTWVAKAYDGFIKVAPFWSKWLSATLPYIQGERLLEVSFGPGYLLTKYPSPMKIYGIDYNKRMVHRAKIKVLQDGGKAKLVHGKVENMPYPDGFFDTVVNTMAFSGYPDGEIAMSEMIRVLKPGGRLLLLDYDYPRDRNFLGFLMIRFIELCGDIMKDIPKIIEESGADYQQKDIGAWGSVQLFIITRRI